MAKEDFSIVIRGTARKFGLDRVSKQVSVPEVIDANDMISAITAEHDASGRANDEYPLGPCLDSEDGTRRIVFAPGWSMTGVNRAKITRSEF